MTFSLVAALKLMWPRGPRRLSYPFPYHTMQWREVFVVFENLVKIQTSNISLTR